MSQFPGALLSLIWSQKQKCDSCEDVCLLVGGELSGVQWGTAWLSVKRERHPCRRFVVVFILRQCPTELQCPCKATTAPTAPATHRCGWCCTASQHCCADHAVNTVQNNSNTKCHCRTWCQLCTAVTPSVGGISQSTGAHNGGRKFELARSFREVVQNKHIKKTQVGGKSKNCHFCMQSAGCQFCMLAFC